MKPKPQLLAEATSAARKLPRQSQGMVLSPRAEPKATSAARESPRQSQGMASKPRQQAQRASHQGKAEAWPQSPGTQEQRVPEGGAQGHECSARVTKAKPRHGLKAKATSPASPQGQSLRPRAQCASHRGKTKAAHAYLSVQNFCAVSHLHFAHFGALHKNFIFENLPHVHGRFFHPLNRHPPLNQI